MARKRAENREGSLGFPGFVAAMRYISHSCLDPNDFTVVNCIVKGHASLSPPSLRLRLCSRFTLLATYTQWRNGEHLGPPCKVRFWAPQVGFYEV
ncbi:hypothetical protein TNCV_2963371 [Trichonephila clavipes]|nr:hypothetical protein TNCV_2963371 [Trichonephila clavipes]